MTWQLAPALVTLRAQINAASPNRNKRSDGTIGDARHIAEGGGSDHNPDRDGIVCALDITHGPHWGAPALDCHLLWQDLANDPRTKYLIFERVIEEDGHSHRYTGVSPHMEHLHISVTQYGKNDPRPWNLPTLTGGAHGAITPPYVPAPPAVHLPPPIPTQELTEMLRELHVSTGPAETWMFWADGTRTIVPNPEYKVALEGAYGPTRVTTDPRTADILKDMTVERPR